MVERPMLPRHGNVAARHSAWVGPVNAKIDGSIEIGKSVKIVVSIQNTGREPAKSFRYAPEPIISTVAEDGAGILAAKIATSVKFCFGTPSLPLGQVIYPTSGFGTGFEFSTEFAADKIDQAVIDGDKLLVVQGCIAYDTFSVTKHSTFCYYFKNKITKPDRLNICANGSDAD
jgi:hypothetical protein